MRNFARDAKGRFSKVNAKRKELKENRHKAFGASKKTATAAQLRARKKRNKGLRKVGGAVLKAGASTAGEIGVTRTATALGGKKAGLAVGLVQVARHKRHASKQTIAGRAKTRAKAKKKAAKKSSKRS